MMMSVLGHRRGEVTRGIHLGQISAAEKGTRTGVKSRKGVKCHPVTVCFRTILALKTLGIDPVPALQK
jgi:hypothetical protein